MSTAPTFRVISLSFRIGILILSQSKSDQKGEQHGEESKHARLLSHDHTHGSDAGSSPSPSTVSRRQSLSSVQGDLSRCVGSGRHVGNAAFPVRGHGSRRGRAGQPPHPGRQDSTAFAANLASVALSLHGPGLTAWVLDKDEEEDGEEGPGRGVVSASYRPAIDASPRMVAATAAALTDASPRLTI